MQFVLSSDHATFTDPVQPVRDEKLAYRLMKLQSQGKGGYLQAARKMIDPLTSLIGGGVAALVLQDCLSQNNVLKKILLGEHQLLSLHLSERNGEYVEEVCKWRKQCSIDDYRWIAVPSNAALLSHKLRDTGGTLLTDCDLSKAADMDRVIAHCAQLATPVSIVTAYCEDGSDQEKITQVLIAFATLRAGGVAVFSIGEFYHHQNKLILWLLFLLFDNVLVSKPATSGSCTNTKFITCSGYRRHCYVAQYESLHHAILQTPLLIEFPLSWSYWLTAQQNRYTLEKETALRRSLQVTTILLQCNTGFSDSQLRHFVEKCYTDKNVRTLQLLTH